MIKFLKYFGVYILLFYKVEGFIPAYKTLGYSAAETLIVTLLWVSFTTTLIYFAVDIPNVIVQLINKIKKYFGIPVKEKTVKRNKWQNWKIFIRLNLIRLKFRRMSNGAVKKIISYSPYLLFLLFPFAFLLIIPGIDSAILVASRLLRIRFALPIFLTINLVKFTLITALCYNWF